MLITMNKSNDR